MENKKKDGVTVKEFETYAKQHQFELFFCLLFILSTLFGPLFWGPALNIFATGAGAIVSTFLSEKIHHFFRSVAMKILAKERNSQLIFALIALIAAIFLAPLVFLCIGLQAGKGFSRLFRPSPSCHAPKDRMPPKDR